MEPAGPVTVVKRRRLGGWLRRTAFAALLLPPLAFGASNLWLGSKWGREAVSSRISRLCGLECRTAGASWSPWNGITLRGLEIAQPDADGRQTAAPLLAVESLRIVPVWREWLRRQPAIRGMEVKRPRIILTTGTLVHLAARMQPPAGTPVAMAEPPAHPSPATPEPEAPGAASPASPPEHPPPAPAPQPEVTTPTSWLKVESAEFRMIGTPDGGVWVDGFGVDAEVPLAGAAADGHVLVSGFSLANQRILTNTRFPLHWQAPFLTLDSGPLRMAGLETRLLARLAFLPGLPLQIAAEIPRQPLAATAGPGGVSGEAREVVLQAGFAGALTEPRTWQGELAASADGVTVRHADRATTFDTATGTALVQGGVLAVPDVRLLGEDLSLLGNGMALADGSLSGVLRIAAPPEAAVALVRRVFPDLTGDPEPVPLSSPQRAALDIILSGSVREPLLRIGAEDPARPSTITQPPP